jgi:Tol biopolymer transport system component
VSVASDGTQANSATLSAAISGDGRYVAFMSYATNLVPGDTNGTTDIFRHDLKTGETVRVSVGPGGRQSSGGLRGSAGSSLPSISRDGRVVAFHSNANGLVDEPHGLVDVYARDVTAGTTELVSVGLGGAAASGQSGAPHVSGDGRYVGFGSGAGNLVAGDTNGVSDGFVRDLKNDLTRRVTLGEGGQQGDGSSGDPVLDGDGDTAAFPSNATDLVAGDTNGWQDVFVATLTK